MSVLAVVSKAVFEKEARAGANVVGVGDTWPTALYASQVPALDSLAEGGALFLVTVRPGDRVWLVGVLEGPKKNSDGWTALANSVPVRDITALVPKLRFTSGKGIAAGPGKLGMSLQTPRQLTGDDEALLRGGAQAEATPVERPALAWRLDAYRRRARSTKLTPKEKALLEPFTGLLEQNDEDGGGIELADVVDSASGKVVALYALWPVDAGALIDVASGEVIADVVESYFDAHRDEGLRTRMRAAVEAAAPAIRFLDTIAFGGGRDASKREPTPAATPDDPAVLAEVRALHAELDRTKGTERDIHAVMRQIGALQTKVLGDTLRPYPMRRWFELRDAERALLELVVDHYEWRLDLRHWGLPSKSAQHEENAPGSVGSLLSRVVGRKPPLALDTLVTLDGTPHPLWAILSDVLIGVRPDAAFLSALDAQPPEVRAGVWRQLATRTDGLAGLHPRDKKELQRGWADPKAQEAVTTRYHALLRDSFGRLEDRGETIALAVLAEPVPPSVYERREIDHVRVAALDGLARLAREAGSTLDAKYDAIIAEIVSGKLVASESLVALFHELPAERAGELTGLDHGLVQAFPSESGMHRVIEQIATNEEWQFAKGAWAKVAAQLAAKFPEAAMPVLVAAKPRLKRYPDGLDKAIEAAEKGIAKAAVRKPAKKK